MKVCVFYNMSWYSYNRAEKADEQTSNESWQVYGNCLIMINGQFYHEKTLFLSAKWTCLNWTCGLFDKENRVATLSTLYLTVSGIIMTSLKSM